MEYGLIGAKLGHSYSKLIHEQLCGYNYQLCALPSVAEAEEFMQKRQFKAINVTIPYKQLVIPYCTLLDKKAEAIGAVNTVVNKGGLLHGYNTDYDGFAYLAAAEGVEFAGRTVLILGTGATSRTVHAVVKNKGAKHILFASRSGGGQALSYSEAHMQAEVQVIVNTSPAGMYPQNGECHIDPAAFANLEAVLDVVYNPFQTELVLRARALGIKAAGGLIMLVAQAACAARLFSGAEIENTTIDQVARNIWADRANVSLVGMPSCGKTTIGKQLAALLGKTFVDLDAEIVKAAGKPIAQIFSDEGEDAFRTLESCVTAQVSARSGQVISTGGGIVKRPQNTKALRQNGVVVFIDRPLSRLHCGGGRPLSTNRAALAEMERQRRPLYEAAADIIIQNTGNSFSKAGLAAKEALDAFFNTQRP